MDDLEKRLNELRARCARDIRVAKALIYISIICILISAGILAAQKGYIWLP